MKTLIVGISDLAVGKNETVLQTNGLGSCIGIILYDKTTKIGGLLHILLPQCTKENEENKAKYADTGIPLLLDTMNLLGANKSRLKAAIYGGADMFQNLSRSSLLSIGSRNIAITKKILNENNIPIINSNVGGHKGRTIIFDCNTGKVNIKTLGESVTNFTF